MMKASQNTISSGRVVTKPSMSQDLSASGSLRDATQKMAEILCARGMCVRVTLSESSIVIGSRAHFDGDPVEFLFVSEKVLLRLFKKMRLINFAMAYFDGRLQINGPISKAVDVLDAMNLSTDQRQSIAEFCWRLLIRSLKMIIPRFGARFESIDHYSQSAKAYELFLDDYMQYTCGHFPKGSEDINQAQAAKFQLIEKLVTKYFGPVVGKSHLDIGCGWGGMGAFFENQFGMNSIGNTNCERQKEYAEKIYGSKILLGDFLELKKSERRFDLITIVGMIEHLTPYRRSQLMDVINHLLTADGIVYLQCITKPEIWIGGDAYRVAKRQIFPGHFLETQAQTEARLIGNGFSILERFEHRLDYARTTSLWVNNIQKNEAELVAILGAKQYRMYLGYLAFANKLFSVEGRGSLMRYVFKRGKPRN